MTDSDHFKINKEFWNIHYLKNWNNKLATGNDNISPLMELLKEEQKHSILEIGCGRGYDSKILLENGFKVISIDSSEVACKYSKKMNKIAPIAMEINHDLPFKEIHFDCILANLSLHYFIKADLMNIIQRLWNRLHDDGIIYGLVNDISTKEFDNLVNETEIESNVFFCKGEIRHYFTMDSLRLILSGFGKIEVIEKKTIYRFQKEKRAIGFLLRK